MLATLSGGTLVIVFVSLVISITIHEAMHAFTSHWLGDDTAHRMGRITLNPLKHIDPYFTILMPLVTLILFKVPLLAAKPVPFNPDRVKWDEYGAALVGLAGPFTNLVLALAGAGLIHVLNGTVAIGVLSALIIFVQINVGLFVFNMLPIPPLDGSRLLYAFAPEAMQDVMRSMERFGFIIVFGLLLAVPAFSDVLIYMNRAVLNVLL